MGSTWRSPPMSAASWPGWRWRNPCSCGGGARPEPLGGADAQLWLEQPGEGGHHIFHLGIVDRPLRSAAPCLQRAGVIGIDADDIDRREVEIEAPRILDPPS